MKTYHIWALSGKPPGDNSGKNIGNPAESLAQCSGYVPGDGVPIMLVTQDVWDMEKLQNSFSIENPPSQAAILTMAAFCRQVRKEARTLGYCYKKAHTFEAQDPRLSNAYQSVITAIESPANEA